MKTLHRNTTRKHIKIEIWTHNPVDELILVKILVLGRFSKINNLLNIINPIFHEVVTLQQFSISMDRLEIDFLCDIPWSTEENISAVMEKFADLIEGGF
jgi:hypothetical protein